MIELTCALCGIKVNVESIAVARRHFDRCCGPLLKYPKGKRKEIYEKTKI